MVPSGRHTTRNPAIQLPLIMNIMIDELIQPRVFGILLHYHSSSSSACHILMTAQFVTFTHTIPDYTLS